MVCADVVLRLGQVDARLAAVRGVDLGDQGRRRLDHGHPALVGGRAESGEIADDAAAERKDAVVAPRAGACERPQDALGLRHRL